MKKYILRILATLGIVFICVVGYVFYEFRNFRAGTLGGFDFRRFPVDKYKLELAVDSLFTLDSTLKMPNNWKRLDDWEERGYDFLDTRIFFFKKSPVEMYYVSFIGDSSLWAKSDHSEIAIRAIGTGAGWTLEENISENERERIENRFDKNIIKRLEVLLNVKAERVK